MKGKFFRKIISEFRASERSGSLMFSEQEVKPGSKVGARSVAVLVMCATAIPTLCLARQMACIYDYGTHVTTLKLDDLDVPDGTISYSFEHSISPTGGEETYLFSESDPDVLQGTGQLKFIMENLYFDPLGTISSIEFVDFEVPTFKQLQAPAANLERSTNMINAPLVVWSCHRTD